MSNTLLQPCPEPLLTKNHRASSCSTSQNRSMPNMANSVRLPTWYNQGRQKAWEEYLELPVPSAKDELWRFSPVKHLWAAEISEPVSPAFKEPVHGLQLSKPLLGQVTAYTVMANSHTLYRGNLPQALVDSGVIWEPIQDALRQHPDLLQQYFMKDGAPLGSEKFAALHYAVHPAGMFLYIPKGIEISLPLECLYVLSGQSASIFPHTLVVAEKNSSVTLLDRYLSSQSEGRGYACSVCDLYLGAGAQVNYACIQNWGSGVVSNQINSATIGRDATAKSLATNLGGAFSRTENVNRMVGAGGHCEMLSLTSAKGSQAFDHRTLQEHQSPNTTSNLLYKQAIDDCAQTIFSGLIRVNPKAHQTDAYQTARNLLLSDGAEAHSMPGLEILANDVKCSHGSTSSHISEDELFYLRSRGIRPQAAKHIITTGFLMETLQHFGQPAITEKLDSLLESTSLG